jgi:hypothetical protein
MQDDLKPTQPEPELVPDEELEDVTGGYFASQPIIATNGQSQLPTDAPKPC